MATASDARAALTETLGLLSAPDVREINALDRPPNGNVHCPATYLGGRTGTRADQAGGRTIRIPVIALAGTDLEHDHDMLDRYIDGDLSIFDLIDANPTLGRDDLSATVVDEWADTTVEIGATLYVGVEFTVEVQL